MTFDIFEASKSKKNAITACLYCLSVSSLFFLVVYLPRILSLISINTVTQLTSLPKACNPVLEAKLAMGPRFLPSIQERGKVTGFNQRQHWRLLWVRHECCGLFILRQNESLSTCKNPQWRTIILNGIKWGPWFPLHCHPLPFWQRWSPYAIWSCLLLSLLCFFSLV